MPRLERIVHLSTCFDLFVQGLRGAEVGVHCISTLIKGFDFCRGGGRGAEVGMHCIVLNRILMCVIKQPCHANT